MIRVSSLRIDYDEVLAVNNVSLEVFSGQIYGFVGPNGAGKTSTIKAMAGVLEPTLGDISLGGFDLYAHRQEALAQVGYMPDFSPVYENLKVWEYLDVFAAAYGYKLVDRKRLVEVWLKKSGLEVKSDSLVKGLSHGMRQRLVLAKTLLPDPKILLLDEPANGLDPAARKQMWVLLKEAASKGAAVLISSHILAELSDYCDAIGVLEKGKMVISGSLEDIRRRMGIGRRVELRFLDQDHSVNCFWGLVDHWSLSRDKVWLDRGTYYVDLPGEDAVAADFLRQLTARGANLTHFCCQKENIEDIFFRVGAKEVA